MSIAISYLIPSYNHAHYLPLLLESIRLDIDRLEVPAEVIIIDDGSSDDSQAVIEAWSAMHKESFSVITLFQENKGLPVVLNKMIAMAQGTYLRLCASDDILIAGSTQKLYEQFKGNAQLRCAFADAIVINDAGEQTHSSSIAYHGGNVQRLTNPKWLVKELIQHWCVAGPSHLMKKSHYENMHYDVSSTIDDYDLFLSLLEIPDAIVFINEHAALYRVHSTNTSKTQNVQRRIANIKSFLSIIDRYMERKTLSRYLSSVRYLTKAKIEFLQKNYIKCFLNMSASILCKVKSEFQS